MECMENVEYKNYTFMLCATDKNILIGRKH